MKWILLVILGISLLVRGAFVTASPPELFGDEVDVGYQAFSLFKTGRDLYGQLFPTYIHSLSEWRAPLLMYATVPAIAVFGNTPLGVRLPQVIFGSLAPLLIYWLVRKTTHSDKIALLSALSLSLTPWHIHYSRVAFEVVILLDLLLAGTALYLRRWYPLSALFFGLTLYTYSTAVIFTPLWIIGLLIVTKKRPSFISCLLLLFTVTPFIYNLFSGQAGARFGLVSIFKSGEVVDKITSMRAGGSSLEPIFHNKPESWVRLFTDNYLRAYSTDFLFGRGDPTVRHNLQYIGQLLPITAPLLVLGLIYLVTRKQWLWVAWLLLAPIPSALTVDGAFHATRLFLMIPPLAVAIAAGCNLIWNLKSSILNLGLLLLLLITFTMYAHYYLVHYPRASWRWWHVGYASAMSQIGDLAPAYSRVFINNSYEPALIRFLFYTDYPPARFQQVFTGDQPRPEIYPGFTGYLLDDKYYFGTFTAGRILEEGSLYLVSQRDEVGGDWDWRTSPPGDVAVISTITNLDNQPVFYLVKKR